MASEANSHADPIAPIAMHLAVILIAAKSGGEVAVRVGQPAVLGELLAGVVLGNAHHLGIGVFHPIMADPAVDILARLGVLLLLFEVGLESTVGQMMRVGWSSLFVAVLGVAAPFALGWGASAMLLPTESGYVHAFIGATLCATSVGITARVLQDLRQGQSPEARVILGAAVIDDVLGLVILTVVTAAIVAAGQGATLSYGAVAFTFLRSIGFLALSLALGVYLSPRLMNLASRLRSKGVLLALGLAICFVFSWLAGEIGLAAIVGAFAAGLVLENAHFQPFTDRGDEGLETLVHPISSFLAPVFFLLMGMRTDLAVFRDGRVVALAATLTLVAVIGKQVSSLGVLGKQVDKLTVGIGMVPRGEVGLIFANIGLTLSIDGRPVVSPSLFSAVVAMVMATTMASPPALKWSLARKSKRLATQGNAPT